MDNKFSESKKYINEMCKAVDIENPERLEIFTKDQLEVIFEAAIYGFNDIIDFFIKNSDFDANQMDEILDGKRLNIQVESYMDAALNWKQMNIIKSMLVKGFTFEELFENGFYYEENDWRILNLQAHLMAKVS